jgi:hypothetical protein
MPSENLKGHKSPGIGKSQKKLLIHSTGKFALRSINLLILFGKGRNCLRSGRSRPLKIFVRRVIKQIVISIQAHHFRQLRKKFYSTSC